MRRSRRMFDEYQSKNYNPDDRYNLAYKRVKRIKGFYIHALVYVLVNAFVICGNYYGNTQNTQNFWSWVNFNTVLFWGVGLLAHGMSVFGRDRFFGQNWEERKIQEFMDKEKSEKWE
jgi:pheromone shutdown protein TraB